MSRLYRLKLSGSSDRYLLIDKLTGSAFLGDLHQLTGDVSSAFALPCRSSHGEAVADRLITIQDSSGQRLRSQTDGSWSCRGGEGDGRQDFRVHPCGDSSSESLQIIGGDGRILLQSCFDLVPLEGGASPPGGPLRPAPPQPSPEASADDLISIGERLSAESIGLFRVDSLVRLAAAKSLRRERFKAAAVDLSTLPILISEIFHSAELGDPLLSCHPIQRIREPLSADLHLNEGRPCIAVFNNNDCSDTLNAEAWKRLFERNHHAFFVVWDHDNHHWLSSSFPIAAWSDCYIPAHGENLANLACLACHQLEIIPCSVSQFRKPDLIALAESERSQPRQRLPITGMHHRYEAFALRNHLIEAVARQFPDSVGFTPAGEYDFWDYAGNLDRWSQYALSFVAPVHGDLPIRVFDSICSGGIPLVPHSTATQLAAHAIPSDHYLVYDHSELIDPQALVNRGLAMFTALGVSGCRQRILHGAHHHHITTSLRQIIDRTRRLLAAG